MMNRYRIFLLPIFILLAAFAHAQQGTMSMNLNYSFGIPVGGLKNSVSENSTRGWQAQIMYGISNQLNIGLGLGYQDFYQ